MVEAEPSQSEAQLTRLILHSPTVRSAAARSASRARGSAVGRAFAAGDALLRPRKIRSGASRRALLYCGHGSNHGPSRPDCDAHRRRVRRPRWPLALEATKASAGSVECVKPIPHQPYLRPVTKSQLAATVNACG